jgi:hypothetical protein
MSERGSSDFAVWFVVGLDVYEVFAEFAQGFFGICLYGGEQSCEAFLLHLVCSGCWGVMMILGVLLFELGHSFVGYFAVGFELV